MKKLLIVLLLTGFVFAKDDTKSTFVGDLVDDVSSTLDSNLTDKIKLETVENYIDNIKFDDKVDKSKYKFNLMAHHANFMLLGGYSSNKLMERHWTNGVEDTSTNGYERDKNEAQFQISIKVPVYKNFLSTGGDLFTAYTQNSYWQVYNTEHSSPFRETNYMPELFLEWQPDKKLGDSTLVKSRFGFIHQSNGQDVGKSRSWNRTEAYFLFKNENIHYGINIWHRWKEDPKDQNDPAYPNITSGDDNPGLTDYIGDQKLFVRYDSKNYNVTLSHQNDIFGYDINRGNTKLDLAFPSINSNFDFFIRYFNGYGESLIDYDRKIERISFGILIADWI